MRPLLALFLAATVSSAGCLTGTTRNETFTVQVTGDRGVAFSGAIAVQYAGGGMVTESVEGVTPRTLQFTADTVSAVLNKQYDYPSTLTVVLLKDGIRVNSGSTSAPYGGVQVTAT